MFAVLSKIQATQKGKPELFDAQPADAEAKLFVLDPLILEAVNEMIDCFLKCQLKQLHGVKPTLASLAILD